MRDEIRPAGVPGPTDGVAIPWWLLASIAGSLAFTFVALGTFVPLRDADGLQYLFVWAGGTTLSVASLLVCLTLAAAFISVRLAARDAGGVRRADARSGRWMAPVVVLALAPLGILPAAPGVGERAAPLAYFLYDLRWWWAAAAVGWSAWRAHALVGRQVERWISRAGFEAWPARRRQRLLSLFIFAIAVCWPLATTPHLRFSGGFHGDEPKYLRYCETWYQGVGLDISAKARLPEDPRSVRPHVLRNILLFARAVGQDVRQLASDIGAFAADPRGFRWNRAEGTAGFLTGKSGSGVYQLHQPGLSALLFPGYFIDRLFFGRTAGYQEEFPDELPLTHATLLAWLGVAAVALFRLLLNAIGSELVAWLASVVAVTSLPVSAFAFQFYPEVPAAAIVLIVVNAVWFGSLGKSGSDAGADGSFLRAALIGAAAGFLPWLHPRFLAVSFVLAGAGVWRARGPARRGLASGYLAGLVSCLALIYHISGSWMPDALYRASEGDVAIESSRILGNLIAYGVHGTWGLVPHAPWLAAVPAGLAVLLRRDRAAAFFVATVVLALAVPASGHSLIAAAGTPGRLVMAVVPLLMWPVGLLVRAFWSACAIRALAAGAVVLSLHAALAYNWSHRKELGAMHDASVSGWKPNLAFPEIRDVFDPAQPGFLLMFGVVMVLLAAAAIAYVRAAARPVAGHARVRSCAVTSIVLFVATVGAASAATGSRGRWTRPEYLVGSDVAHRRAAEALVSQGRCRVCFTSRRSQVDWTWLTPNPAREPQIRWAVEDRVLLLDVDLGSDGGLPGFGRVLVDFGDGSTTGWAGVVGLRELTHPYAGAGEFRVVISVELPGGLRVERPVVTVK